MIQAFSSILQKITEISKIQGLAGMASLQEQITLYIQRSITILGAPTQGLIFEHITA